MLIKTRMIPTPKKVSAWVALFSITFYNLVPTTLYSQEKNNAKSVVIIPQKDGTFDDVSDDTAAALRGAIPLITPVHIVSPQIVEKVLSYYSPQKLTAGGSPTQGSLTQGSQNAAELLSSAKEHYFNFHYDEALAEASKSIEIWRRGSLSENGEFLLDALITQGVIAKAAGKMDIARTSFEEAARLNPLYRMDYRAFPPSIVQMFEEARVSALQKEKGLLRVESDPAAAEVFLNGVLAGITPLELSDIPAGSYSVTIKTNKYKPLEKNIGITGGQKTIVSEKLRWADQKPTPPVKTVSTGPQTDIASGAKIAELLKVDKAVLIDSDSSGQITARVIDRRYKASLRPIVVKYDAQSEVQAIADLSEAVADFINVDVLADPSKYLDKEGGADPVVLANNKRKIYQYPVFWAGVGSAAAGAIAGGIVAAMSGGSKQGTGNIAVQFK